MLVAGCSGSTPGTPFPTGGGAATTPPSSGVSGPPGTKVTTAPEVTTPLDTTKYQQNPCSVLNAAQLAEFHPTASRATTSSADNASGPACAWVATAPYSGLGIIFRTSYDPGTPHGLAWDLRGGPLLRLPDIDGQPALLIPLPTQETCQVDIGATNDVMFRITVRAPAPVDVCATANKVATEVITNMKSGA